MRPDQHKTKKNEQYKRQHRKGKESNSTAEQNSTKKGELKKGNSVEFRTTKKKSVTNDCIVGKDFRNENSNDFGKRALHSNWERYDEKDEDVVIGEDINVVLSTASGVSSHFKLDIEKDWDTYPEFDSIFAVDCQKMVTDLEKLSFCELYDIDPRDIDPELLQIVSGNNVIGATARISGGLPLSGFSLFNQDAFDFFKPGTMVGQLNTANSSAVDQVTSKLTGMSTTCKTPTSVKIDVNNENEFKNAGTLSMSGGDLSAELHGNHEAEPADNRLTESSENNPAETHDIHSPASGDNHSTISNSPSPQLESELDMLLAESALSSGKKPNTSNTHAAKSLKAEYDVICHDHEEDQGHTELEDWLDSIL